MARLFLFALSFCFLHLVAEQANAYITRGAGTAALRGGDLTDPENNGVDGAMTNWNWIAITASSENSWTAEGAYNIFDNLVGGGDEKWCCDPAPQSIAVQFDRPYVLTHFTLSSANDVPERDPTQWYIEGSNNGTNWTPIYSWTNGISPFSQRLEVLEFTGNGGDFPTPASYSWFRYRVQANGDLILQIGELELFGVPVKVIKSFAANKPLIFPGEPFTLSWELEAGTTAASIGGIGSVLPFTTNGIGSVAVNPGAAATTTYTLSATHPLSSATQNTTVTVTNQPIVRSFTATPPITGPGASTRLAWDVANAASVRLDGAAVGGSSISVSPATTRTYNLSATNPNGTVNASTTVSVVIPGVPVIHEFMADNDGAQLVDADGFAADWIEIHNPGGSPLDLAGFFLTDDPADLQKWAFPAVTLAPGAYRIVFASGKNRTGVELHTNFSLDAAGEYLAFIKPDGVTIVSEFGSSTEPFPEQKAGISFGIIPVPPQPGYFSTATPRAANSAGFQGFVKDTKFSVDRGFYSTAQTLTLTTATPGATIRYTTNGSRPSETAGTIYTAPITVNRTMPVRAIAFKAGHRPTNVDTNTYIFVDDVVTQTPGNTQSVWGLPATWGSQSPDYGMDPRVTSLHGATIRNDLKTVPSISIACETNDLFGPSGIYSNPNSSGAAWERGISFEIIDPAAPDGSKNKQANCGLRIQGGAFRSFGLTLKKSLRVLFKTQYGPSKLNYPLFGPQAAQEFDTFILRMESNDGYQWDNRTDVQYARDEFARRSALDVGILASRGRYMHVYLNGVYWGLFNPVERPDAGLAASYLGSVKEEWDGINSGTATNEGSVAPWNTMLGLADDITTTITESARTAALMRLQGLNPDGTDNPAWSDYINVDNYINYLLVNWYTGNNDWPHKNYYNGRERDLIDALPLRGSRSSTGFHFFMWDSEWAMLLNSSNDKTGEFSGAAAPQQYLRNSLEYRVRFGDRAHRSLFNGGALTPQRCLDRYADITKDHRSIIIPELARWGDQHGTLRTIANWESAYNNVRNNWLAVRTPGLITVLKSAGLYPQTDAPVFSRHGGSVLPATPVTMATNADRIYYTVDGSDPRLLGGAPNPAAQLVTFGGGGPVPVTFMNTGHVWKYWAGSNQGTAWQATNFVDTAWPSGPSSLGYGGDGESSGTLVPSGTSPSFYPTTYFRTTVTIPAPGDFVNFLLRLKYDDEAAVYINGTEVIRTAGLPAGAAYTFYTGTNVANEAAFKDFTIATSRFVPGVNVIAVEVHQTSGTSSDIRMDMFLRGEVSVGGRNVSNPLFFSQPTTLTTRAFSSGNGEWSALNSAFFSIDTVSASAANLVVSELCYRPAEATLAAETAISTDRDDYEFIELRNISAQTVDLTGVSFLTGITFTFQENTLVAPSGSIVVAKNAAAFSQRHLGVNTAGSYSGNLGNDGEQIVLTSSRTGVIRDFTYNDAPPWPAGADGEGFSLVLIAPVTNPDHNLPQNWRTSAALNGNPGSSDSTAYAAWKAANGITDDLGDSDRDGVNNFGEFAMGTGPATPSTAGLPVTRTVNVSGVDYWAIDVRRSLAATDNANLVVESSTALGAWNADLIPIGEINHGDGTATVTWRSAQPFSGTTRQFVRARFVLR